MLALKKNYEHYGFKNKSKDAVKNHTEDKHFGNVYLCTSGTKLRLRNHRQKEHVLICFPCTACSYIGKTNSKYQYHILPKPTIQHYLCVNCNKKFNSRTHETSA